MLEKESQIHKTYLLFCWRHFFKTEVVQNTDLNILTLYVVYNLYKTIFFSELKVEYRKAPVHTCPYILKCKLFFFLRICTKLTVHKLGNLMGFNLDAQYCV